jgi:DNA-binding transcriptional regulator YdaS (Cro superfamily)
MSPFDALKIEFGTLTQLASLLRMKETALYQWVKRGQIPIKHVKRIEQLSQGRLTAEMLRPDLFGK